MTKKQNSKDSIDGLSRHSSQKMKISLFIKPLTIKVYSLILGVSFVASIPFSADASFFSDISDLFLGQAKADETEIITDANSSSSNSQNMSLSISNTEPSVDPDIKNADANSGMVIVQEDSFISNEGSYIPDVKFEKSPLSDQIMIYTVEEGDTLSEIAETFDVSVNTIRWENNISGNTVPVGKKLNILPTTGVKHTVQSGDTVAKIATKYDAESEDIFIFNGISKEDGLKKGDIIFVPNGIIKPVSVKSTSSSSGKVVYSNTKATSGYYAIPVSGRVTSPYGSRKMGFHYGIDFGNVRGTPIYAAASGTVVKVVNGCVEGKTSCGGRYGNYIVISHSNGTKTFYAHLSKLSVSVGQSVKQGQKIGAMGNTGRSTGSHLHFEIENANGSKMRPVF